MFLCLNHPWNMPANQSRYTEATSANYGHDPRLLVLFLNILAPSRYRYDNLLWYCSAYEAVASISALEAILSLSSAAISSFLSHKQHSSAILKGLMGYQLPRTTWIWFVSVQSIVSKFAGPPPTTSAPTAALMASASGSWLLGLLQ